MADKVAHGKVIYSADDGDFQRASNRVFASTKKITAAFKVGAVAAVAVGASYLALTKRALDVAEALNDTAIKANSSVEGLQKLRFVADQNGASARDMDDALTRLTRRMSLFATDGGGPAAKAIKGLNLQILDANGNLRASDQVFLDIVAKLGSFSTNAEKAAYASALFGEDAGPRLMASLNQGVSGIADLSNELVNLNGVLDGAAVQKAAEANAELRKLWQVLGTQLNNAILDNVDSIGKLVEVFARVVEYSGPVLGFVSGLAADLLNTAINAAEAAAGIAKLMAIGPPTPPGMIATTGAQNEGYNAYNPYAGSERGRGSVYAAGGRLPGYSLGLPTYAPGDTSDGDTRRGPGRGGDPRDFGLTPEEIVKEYYEHLIRIHQENQEKIEKGAAVHADRMAEISNKTRWHEIDTADKMYDSLIDSFAGGNKKILATLKAFKSAQALINAYAAASDALGDPTVPFWGKIAAVGQMLAVGMGLVNNIKSVTGSGGGAGAGAGVSGSLSPASAPAQGTYVNLALNGDFFTADSVRNLIGKINEAIEDGAVIRGVRA
jgi:hypothetical protein